MTNRADQSKNAGPKAERQVEIFRKPTVETGVHTLGQSGVTARPPRRLQLRLGSVFESMHSFLRLVRNERCLIMSTTLSHSCVVSTTPLSPLEQFYHFQEADDEILIAGLKELNELALEELIRRYSGRLCGYACLRLDDLIETPEVIVNGAFWTLWSGFEKGRYGDVETVDDFLGLIITLVKNSIYQDSKRPKNSKAWRRSQEKKFRLHFSGHPRLLSITL